MVCGMCVMCVRRYVCSACVLEYVCVWCVWVCVGV